MLLQLITNHRDITNVYVSRGNNFVNHGSRKYPLHLILDYVISVVSHELCFLCTYFNPRVGRGFVQTVFASSYPSPASRSSANFRFVIVLPAMLTVPLLRTHYDTFIGNIEDYS